MLVNWNEWSPRYPFKSAYFCKSIFEKLLPSYLFNHLLLPNYLKSCRKSVLPKHTMVPYACPYIWLYTCENWINKQKVNHIFKPHCYAIFENNSYGDLLLKFIFSNFCFFEVKRNELQHEGSVRNRLSFLLKVFSNESKHF